MEYIRELDMHDSSDLHKLEFFLQRFDLQLDGIDYGAVMEKDGTIIASCCKLKNIFKCFAIDPAYQGEGITNTLMTQVTYKMFEEGYQHSFVFTKPSNLNIFLSLGFTEILTTNTVALLEKGSVTITRHIQMMKEKHGIRDGNHGAIVMNGNPFTLGHQYLIETAAAQCDQLIVFVVEEDASSFPFRDRFALIREGTKHLDNVITVPSSHYLISRATFPNYFLRDAEHGFASYAELDVLVFARYFARMLSIKERFAGEEPLDLMTRKYNETMLDILPKEGIKVTVIPRRQNDSGVISASKVRQLLREDRWEEIKAYVPVTTYEYLKHADAIIASLKQHDGKH